MKKQFSIFLLFFVVFASFSTYAQNNQAVINLSSKNLSESSLLRLDGLFYETAAGRIALPAALTVSPKKNGLLEAETKMADGRAIKLSIVPEGQNFNISFTANPGADIIKWGLAIDALPGEYYTGLMERVVDGPQQASW